MNNENKLHGAESAEVTGQSDIQGIPAVHLKSIIMLT
jgi:hypothetical protein